MTNNLVFSQIVHTELLLRKTKFQKTVLNRPNWGTNRVKMYKMSVADLKKLEEQKEVSFTNS